MFYPFKFIPVYKDYIWGGRSLERFGRVLPEGIVAESWDVSCHQEGLSVISNGEYAGKSLYEMLQKYRRQIMGFELPEKDLKEFPLLVKLIDANQRLSVQVHPDDGYAGVHENTVQGKNEAWYVISAKPEAKIVYALEPGVDKRSFADCIKNNEIEKCLNYIQVSKGDVINIPAGIIHSIGEGILLLEIQQNSNCTYRVYDYDRTDENGNKRELHVDKAMDVIDFDIDNQGKALGLDIDLGGNSNKRIMIANKHFAFEIYDIEREINENADGSKFMIYTVVEGDGVILYKDGSAKLSEGETVLIPAWMGDYTIKGDIKLIKTYVPDLEKDVVLPLKNCGYTEEQISSNICGLKLNKRAV